MKFQEIYAKHFNIKNQIKSMFAAVCITYYIFHCKTQMNLSINSQKDLQRTFCFNLISKIIKHYSISFIVYFVIFIKFIPNISLRGKFILKAINLAKKQQLIKLIQCINIAFQSSIF